MMWVVLLMAGLIFATKQSLGWMCLEQCDFSATQIQDHLTEISQHKASLDAVVFQQYELSETGGMLKKNLTNVASSLLKIGVAPMPVIGASDESWDDWPRYCS